MGSYLEKKKEIAGEDLEVEAKRPDWVIDTQIKHTPWAVTSSSFHFDSFDFPLALGYLLFKDLIFATFFSGNGDSPWPILTIYILAIPSL